MGAVVSGRELGYLALLPKSPHLLGMWGQIGMGVGIFLVTET